MWFLWSEGCWKHGQLWQGLQSIISLRLIVLGYDEWRCLESLDTSKLILFGSSGPRRLLLR